SNSARICVAGNTFDPGRAGTSRPVHSVTPRAGSAVSHCTYSGENQGAPGSHRCISNHSVTRGATPYRPGEQPQICQDGSENGAARAEAGAEPTRAIFNVMRRLLLEPAQYVEI